MTKINNCIYIWIPLSVNFAYYMEQSLDSEKGHLDLSKYRNPFP